MQRIIPSQFEHLVQGLSFISRLDELFLRTHFSDVVKPNTKSREHHTESPYSDSLADVCRRSRQWRCSPFTPL